MNAFAGYWILINPRTTNPCYTGIILPTTMFPSALCVTTPVTRGGGSAGFGIEVQLLK
jgi:hypothetical protein